MPDGHDIADFLDSGFWDNPEPLFFLNPRLPYEHAGALGAWLVEQDALAGHILFRTSGSETQPKFVALSKEALLASAKAVNRHLETNSDDRWLGSLPLFHVGGFGIAARSFAAEIPVTFIGDQPWDPSSFQRRCHDTGATLCSLVPTQVFDLVRDQLTAPASLRAVLVGGGRLEGGVAQAARRLGWPIITSYGMTEAASQVATEVLGNKESCLQVLDEWEVRLKPDGFLQLRGAPLFTAYVIDEGEGRFSLLNERSADGWWTSHDQVNLWHPEGRTCLQFQARRKHLLKIKGELVNLGALRERLDGVAAELRIPSRACTFVAIPDDRDGEALVLVSTEAVPDPLALGQAFNLASPGFERVHYHARIPEIPRTALGKIAEAVIGDVVRDATREEFR